MERFKNYALWVAIFALIGLFVDDLGLLEPTKYQTYVDAILVVLVSAGIISNPSLGKGYKDKI
ncbi:holin (plasmid) [Bacillus carboniphilus]|uniref:Holin n=1 Tax=Bacillus carboniphilus TaxID=86663 RepID=A0ABY9K1C2_9BACI|nr:holin [Bacillus carboniphilus]WLR44490.1 holin [Bacillus carboniphilus]